MWSGDFVGAEILHSEATEISVALGADAAGWEALKVELFAWQGRDEDTRFVAGLLSGELRLGSSAGIAVNLAHMAMTILEIAEGHYDDALRYGLLIMSSDACPHGSQVLPDVVEAAVRNGGWTHADEAIERLRVRTEASGTPWALGVLARSQALVTGDDPEPLYRRALDLLGSTYVKTDLARAHLLYGEWLRRERRRTDARGQLRLAHQLFDRMGATAFAERARVELAATGGRPRPSAGNRFQLTPQEHQIATLAGGGSTNVNQSLPRSAISSGILPLNR
jgi:hypothetical protein